jgi:hypothetical protein
VGQPGHYRGDELGAELVDERAEQVLGHAGLGHRGDGVGLDVVLGALYRQHPGEADQAGLGRAVVGLAEVAEDAGRRGSVDDAAVVLFAHHAPGGQGDVEGALEVDVDDRLELLRVHVLERSVSQDAGVVDDDVDLAEGVEARSG